MATREEIKAKIQPRLEARLRSSMAWGTVVAAVASATAEEKDEIVAALAQGSHTQIGHAVINLVMRKIKTDASDSADTMLADDQLSLDDLDLVL